MNWLVLAALSALILSPFLFSRVTRRAGRLKRRPYQKHVAIFSSDDRAFFRPLRQAMGEDYEIFGKIRVADILIPKKSHPADVKDESADPVAGRHFDFVLCDKATLAVSCVVQLYDKALASRQPEPDPLQAICENLGLPYARFQIKADYSVEEIRGKLLKALVKEPAYLIETDGRKEPRISSLDDIEI